MDDEIELAMELRFAIAAGGGATNTIRHVDIRQRIWRSRREHLTA